MKKKLYVLMILAVSLFCTCIVLAGCGGRDSADAEQTAAEIYTNGVIYTVEGENWDKDPRQAMAVAADGTILAVGTNEEISEYADGNTQTIDLEGKAVYPGFIDSHVHTPGTAMTDLYEINNYYDFNIEDTMATITDFVENHPEMDTYWGDGFNFGMFGDYIGCSTPDADHPSPRALLDAVCSDKPMVLISNDMHGRWLNSKALEMAGIDRDTEPEQGGNIHHTKDGEPNGLLTDVHFTGIDQEYTKEQNMEGMKTFANTMNAWGYTACSTAWSENIEDAADLDKAGELTMKMNFSTMLHQGGDLKENMELLDESAAAVEGCENVTANTAKVVVDGVVEGYTAYMTEPYVGTAAEEKGADWAGSSKWKDEELLNETMLEIAKRGMQIHVHAIGDAGIKMAVDGIEYAQENAGEKDYRNVITHLQVVREEDKTRMGELGIIGAIQPFWFLKEPDWYEPVDLNVLGEERAENEYPEKSLMDQGIRLTFSGDYPVSPTNNPFWALEAACTRNLNNPEYYEVEDITDPDDPTYLLNAAERISMKDAIEAYTINGAYQMFKEDTIGSLAAGKAADFIILNGDPMTVDVLKVDSIEVLKTYVDGKLVYEQ